MKIFADDRFTSTLPEEDSGRRFLNTAFQYDKVQHAVGSLFVAFLAGSLFTPLAAAAVALCFGVLWEIKDIFMADGFSWRDLVADAAGIVVYGAVMWRHWIWTVL